MKRSQAFHRVADDLDNRDPDLKMILRSRRARSVDVASTDANMLLAQKKGKKFMFVDEADVRPRKMSLKRANEDFKASTVVVQEEKKMPQVEQINEAMAKMTV